MSTSETTVPSPEDSKTRREKLKLIEAECRLEEIKFERQRFQPPARKFNRKDFFKYIFPALLNVLAAIAGIWVLYSNHFFDVNTKHQENKNMELKFHEDSLRAKKTVLDSIIRSQEGLIVTQKTKYDKLFQDKIQIASDNQELKQSNNAQQTQIQMLNSASFEDAINNFFKDGFWRQNEKLNSLVDISRNKKTGYIYIKNYLDRLSKNPAKKKDTVAYYSSNLKLYALRYFCFGERADKAKFAGLVNDYLRYFHNRFTSKYDSRFLDLLISDKWNFGERNANLLSVMKMSHNNFQKVQLYRWATQIYTDAKADVKLYRYYNEMHLFLMQEASFLYGNGPIDGEMLNPNFERYYKDVCSAILAESPQTFFAIFSKTIYNSLQEAKSLEKLDDPKKGVEIKVQIKDGKMDGNALALWKFNFLINLQDIIASQKDQQEIYLRFLKKNKLDNLLNFDEDITTVFLQYYEAHQKQIDFLLADETIRQFNNPEIQRRVIKTPL